MQPQIRAGLLVNLKPTVELLGGDVSSVLAQADLPIEVMANTDDFIPYAKYLRLLDAAAQHTHCPHFGLVMSRELGAENMGVTGFVMTQASDVAVAWKSLQRFYHVHDTYGTVILTESGRQACVHYDIPRAGLPGERQSLDVAAGVATNIHRMLTGGIVDLTSLHFPYPEPLDLAPYEFLQCSNIQFDQAGFAMFFPAASLHMKVANSDPQMKVILDAYLESLEISRHHGASRQVEELIKGFLPTGDCTLPHVSRFLSVSVRTLQNRLDAEHTSFQMLLDKVRKELAITHLSKGDLQLTQLAYLLGYSEPSAFSRSFKRWFGSSPRDWQRSQETTSLL